ncbi:DUF4271 domain-containing protein [Flavobacterium luteum]|uniref:DUF4271 domain-containing protein n=1 Tax=Flavobacterium luteum TaxID=2026654 RepID=A0A7J5AHG6_9FLAO|nr:DUF4271 domain-containing protein [Flavobacterium luteum]KAB1156838.1 DUF4271 domain-containing protein [Flavobacterium luteum]
MNEIVFHPRVLDNKDWATILFVVAFALIAFTKSVFEIRFIEFLKLIVSDKYLKIYRDSSLLLSGFTIILFFVQVVSLSFFIQLTLHHFGFVSKTDWIVFIQITTLILFFILSKFLLEKIISTSFDIEEFIELYNLQKVSYRTYIGLLILPIDVILFYNNNSSKFLILFFIATVLIINVVTYILSLKNYQNLIFGKLFYFILYLCALEIAPYYFIYYWFTKS